MLMDNKNARNEAADLALQRAFTTDVLRLAEQRGIIASIAEIVEGLRAGRIYLPFGSEQRRGSH